MNVSAKELPTYLKQYCVEQNYSSYTATQQSTWRYIMRQNRAFFAEHAVDIYVEGLKQTGIPIDKIPNIQEVDQCLQRFGYGAVAVCGFIPPAIFLEFQARGIMPIAADMRTLEHLQYTPAPDIVHEAAGHVPIVADPAYRHYLRSYGQIANKAIFSAEDVKLYEAIRYLSDIKENPDTKPEDAKRAQTMLDEAVSRVHYASESTMVARMGWWTIEYGLVGNLNQPKIYGAGLLSSVGESQNCLGDTVRKIPLSLDCVQQSYDITEPQPQLFVAQSLEQLPDVLADLEQTMAYRHGGIAGLTKAKQAQTVNSLLLDSGLAIGGRLTDFQLHREDLAFFKMEGPCQFGWQDEQLSGHGREHHPHGFSSPIGRWQDRPNQPATTLRDGDLEALGLIGGQRASLKFVNGFVVDGVFQRALRRGEKLLALTWDDCTVTRGAERFYEPDWGVFDMAVGEVVTSVYAGPPDREGYGEYDIGTASTTPARQSPFTESETIDFFILGELRKLRTQTPAPDRLEATLADLAERILTASPKSWLPALEVVELTHQHLNTATQSAAWYQQLRSQMLEDASRYDKMTTDLISKGLQLAEASD